MERVVSVNGTQWYKHGQSLWWHELDAQGKPTGHRGRNPGRRDEFYARLS